MLSKFRKLNKMLCMLLIATMIIIILPMGDCFSATNKNPNAEYKSGIKFTDVKEDAWFIQSVLNLKDNKILSGYTDGTLKPENNITVAEFTALLLRTMGYDGGKEINNSNKLWYASYMDRAMEAGIINSDESYKYNTYLCNSDAAKMVCRSLSIPPNESGIGTFNDLDTVYKNIDAKWIYAIYNEYLMTGYFYNGNRNFRPADGMLRSEAFELISNLIDYKNDPAAFKEKAEKRLERQVTIANTIYEGYSHINESAYPPAVTNYLQINHEKETQSYFKAGNKYYIALTMGNRPCPGYFIYVVDAGVKDNELLLTVRYHYNISGGLTVVTEPISVMEFNSDPVLKHIKVVIQK